jgi:DNA/RNA non-specific endonuclease
VNVTMEATDGSAPWSTFVNLTAAAGTPAQYLADTQRIGYGTTGFETFTFDIPERFRGKTATLRFEASGGTVYLDNVFFKSQHLLFGNPTDSRATGSPVPNVNFNNYLLEKPQYSSSFSGDDHIPNWSAWQINSDWLGSGRPSRDFFIRDNSLTEVGFVSAKSTDYTNRANSDIVPGPVDSNGAPLYKLAPGHLASNGDRNRFFLNPDGSENYKDSIATYSTANIIPQNEKITLHYGMDLKTLPA